MPKIELQYLLRQTSTPEQQLFLSWFYSNFDNDSAAHKRILSVEPIYYQGVIAGSEFLVYAATKIYLTNFIKISSLGYSDVNPYVSFFNESNANSFNGANYIGVYNSTLNVLLFGANNLEMKDFYFSRFALSSGQFHLMFNGYRITLN